MPPRRKTLEEYFWLRVEKTESCWLWKGLAQKSGHGRIVLYRNAPTIGAHRASWALHNGPIPEGLFVCHKCDNPPCVNPDHLFVGTCADNIHDAWNKGRGKTPDQSKWLKRTVCSHGHPFDEKNTYWNPRGSRQCRECHKLNCRARYAKIKKMRKEM